MIYTIRDTA